MKKLTFILFLFFITLFTNFINTAQSDCEVADRLDFPIDRNNFTLVQDYGVPSSRHQGRYHTGEDWFGGRDNASTQPIYAIANGRVTFSDPNAWGRDGGVVIIEHRFPDESVFYSMYGHIGETGNAFPRELTCVIIGQPIGNLLDVRPSPHLHFEIRTNNPDTAGAGYTRETPDSLGYLKPSEFILNQQTWLRPSHEWHVRVSGGLIAPPLVLNDNSLLYLDSENALRRLLPDGRILWRNRLEKPAVAVSAYQGESVVNFVDGDWQLIDVETGELNEGWLLQNFTPTGAPFPLLDWLVFPSENNTLVAIDNTRRNIVWTLEDVPPFKKWYVSNEGVNAIIALLTYNNEVLQIAGSGVLLGRTQLRYPADFAQTSNGDLLVYSWGGMWQVGVDGVWQGFMEAPHGGTSGAMVRENGQTLLFDGQVLHAFDTTNAPQWQTEVLGIHGTTELTRLQDAWLLLGSNGVLVALNNSGQVCNQAQMFGDSDLPIWTNLGNDGTLRVAIGEYLMGFNATQFKSGC
jgi:hypothetical protein